MEKCCLIYNYAQHYRTEIFELLDKNLHIDFYFGDKMFDVKKMDYSLLHNPVKELVNINVGPCEWQRGVVSLAFKQYDNYIMLGAPMCLSTWLAASIARLKGKRVYFWTHGWYGKESLLQRKVKKVFYSLANTLLLYGNYARELMIKEGFDPNKLFVIHNSLAYDKQLSLRNTLHSDKVYQKHFGNNNPNLFFVGRLTKVKKLDQALFALAKCKENGHFFNLTFIGDGEVKRELMFLAKELGVEDYVWFYGACYDETELGVMIYNADLCVSPGNVGLTAIHSLTFGTPVITHNDFPYQMPEFEAIKPSVTGDFFERDSINSLAETITLWLMANRNRRDVIRNNCFNEIDEKWNPHKQLEIIKEVLTR